MRKHTGTFAVLVGFIASSPLAHGCAGVPNPPTRPEFDLITGKSAEVIGLAAFKLALAQSTEIEDEAALELVQTVKQKLAAASDVELEGGETIDAGEWDIHVIKGDTATAAAFVGGKILVREGLLRDAGYDPQKVAVVRAHEMEHARRMHFKTRLQEDVRKTLNTAIESGEIATTLKTKPEIVVAVGVAMGFALNEKLPDPFARAQELEADRASVALMRGADYDPIQVLLHLERERTAPNGDNGADPTHPPFEQRLREVRKLLTAEELAEYKLITANDTFGANDPGQKTAKHPAITKEQ